MSDRADSRNIIFCGFTDHVTGHLHHDVTGCDFGSEVC
jgi:hypothetical protein